ncbi:alpha/beta hydrolase [Methylobacterium sp. C25]|uniref:alpha/beta fold hydrolase n=1 Tax=Methylobacterium sp. C25 TaxID=2721622 RepID=UPI001F275D2C|nr:alpha/beta hydrolase [Methylobacterium sp. C25]MCE4226916.1 alpha/beta hydrolase [Methylobacterium sp. C25]
MPEVSAAFLELGTVRLELLRAGPGPQAGPTLIYLHEGLGSAQDWTGLMLRLVTETGLGAVAYTRQGYGASSPVERPRPLDYLEREARDVLPAILDALSIHRCVLIGHSDGATIATLAAATGDPRIHGAVLIAPHVFAEDVTLAGIEQAKAAFERGGLRRALARRHDDVEGAFYGWCDAWLAPLRRDWSIVPALCGVTVPIAIIQGDKDPYGSSRQAELIAQYSHGPVGITNISDVGHFPHRDKPEIIEQEIMNLIRI